MNIEKCPVVEMPEEIENPVGEYSIAPDGTVIEANDFQENPESFNEK